MKGNGEKRKKLIAGITLTTLLIGSGSVYATSYLVAGPQANGTGVTSYGWTLTPAGKQLTLGGFPMGSAMSPDHKYLVVTNDGQGTQSLQVVDISQQKVIQTIPYKSPESLFLGVTFSPDGQKLYASAAGNNKIRVFDFNNGSLSEQSPIIMKDQNHSNFYPSGISISPDGKSLYTANNKNNSVSCINLSTGTITTTTPVGKDPYMTLLSHDGSTLYVSNWGESSVTVLNAKDLTIKKTINVGLHPNAIGENPATNFIYVSNSDTDEISVIDPQPGEVVQTISLAPYKNALTGSQPDSLTFSPDGKTLYVANAGNNDIVVIDLGNAKNGSKAKIKGLIPTAWYPTTVSISSDGKQLYVLNGKGLGAGHNPNGPNPYTDESLRYNPQTQDQWQSQYIGTMMKGTMSFIQVPNENQQNKYTEQVKQNNTINKAEEPGLLRRLKGETSFPIPRFSGEHSPIKHVIYIIKENRTYDQVFGDLEKGNGDPKLAFWGKNITPNLHKLANQFVTLDNFYTDAEVSSQGHNWSTAAKANDFTEKNTQADYSGRRSGDDFEGGDPAAYSQAGFIWDAAKRAGVSFRDYGEFVNYDKNKGWYPKATIDAENVDPQYPGWNLDISDVTRVDEWAKEFNQFEKNGNLPQFEMVRLPNDHTNGTSPGHWTPNAMGSQNDYAVGKLVDTVSHSKDWKDTAIFVVEDDSQAGPDHVDAHRSEALVISPYTQTGKVDSTFYDTASMLRTMELTLGLKSMTQYDASAIPMLNAFTNHPNFDSYNVEQPIYPIDLKNGENAPMAQISKQLDFSKEDSANPDTLNHIIWKATEGSKPYPVKK
ncbi:bifunctional YncE family protein/alkaline phosphatase family protein [Aneurinibacillus sp. Ricciae_BoGa-3]|uniref:bifunctional YncE family protein/alkaline phosphatase family protein n=1 Tax=Aneurinibacillus sp. Ricciae_BoGa-3 TaxID=3022697 RepID=UPI002340395D|nr:bifunctional YncE family protein/alkaline phosphatase family protein [Aneurinibacillus sp. Ricciae_BoGa-3]WCK52363.1 bifunctional YncE family protein/alkaline phosphatase family protein [Aneurinibacillus sp. Ricciae_BoGa-3]